MGLFFDLITQRKTFQQIAPLIRDISNRCHADVWDRVRDLIFEMDLTEARGYVRARAVKVARRHVECELQRHPHLGSDAQQQLRTLVTERVVNLVITDFVAGSPVARRPAA